MATDPHAADGIEPASESASAASGSSSSGSARSEPSGGEPAGTEPSAPESSAPEPAPGDAPPTRYDRVTSNTVRVRRAPRYGRFMALGALLGLLVGWLAASASTPEPGTEVDTSSVIPFMMAVGVIVGLTLGAVVAVVLDRILRRRRATLQAERVEHHDS